MKVDCIVDYRCYLGESPVWSPSARALYWLDIAAPSTLLEWSSRTRAVRSWTLNELASGLAFSQNARLIVVSQTGLSTFDTEQGVLRTIVSAPFSMRNIRFNDCGCDRAGRLWTGTMLNNFESAAAESSAAGNDAKDCLYRFDPDLSHHIMAQGFGCPNTFAWSPDNETMYVADSVAGCIYTYRFDLPAGAISDRCIFANPDGLGVPDGSAIDCEGYLWNARWGAGCVVRFAPDGSVAGIVRIPAKLVTSCSFGGEALDTLFITTAHCDLSQQQLHQEPFGGRLFAFKPKAPGIPETPFRLCV